MCQSLSILIVEDDDDIRLTLRDYLTSVGHTVFVASEGVGAITALLDHDVSAIITDFRMPLFGGDTWLRFLRRYCADTPVLVVSGYLPLDVPIPFPVFTKPIDYSEIEERVRELVADDHA